jgi:hypothetical protein
MARKKSKPPAKKPARKPAARQKASATQRASAVQKAPAPAAAPTIVVLYQLRDVAGVRFHSEHADPTRAGSIARQLSSSPDVDLAWIIRDAEIFKA